jgi:putative endonuclease
MRSTLAAVYIMTNRNNTVLYTGVTSDLRTRVFKHKMKLDPSSFASRYNLDKLVYLETTANIAGAIAREKQIKGWIRKRKVALIEATNPAWKDLSADWSL